VKKKKKKTKVVTTTWLAGHGDGYNLDDKLPFDCFELESKQDEYID